MKKIRCLWIAGISAIVLLTGYAHPAVAQIKSAGEIVRGGQADAQTLFQEYLKPYADGLGANLNSGWFSRAKPNDAFKFDIMVRTSIAMVPITGRNYFVDELDLENLQLVEGTPKSPTAFGGKAAGPVMAVVKEHPITGELEEVTRFALPNGTGSPYMSAPLLQVNMGLGANTEVSVRYVPKTPTKNARIGMTGIGIKHGLNHWFKKGEQSVIDFSMHFGYTRLFSDFGLEVLPEVADDIYNPFRMNPTVWDGQSIDLRGHGIIANIIAGRNFSTLSVFVGVGFQASRMMVDAPGAYPTTTFNPEYDPEDFSEETRLRKVELLYKPVKLDFMGANNLHTTGGLSMKIGFVNLTTSFVLSRYTVANIGAGIRF